MSCCIFVSKSKVPVVVEEDELDVEAEVKLELELFCAAAYIPDRPVLVIINPTNVNEIRRTETFVSDLFLCITCSLARMKYRCIYIYVLIMTIILIEPGVPYFLNTLTDFTIGIEQYNNV
jgi:hypothetical protein